MCRRLVITLGILCLLLSAEAKANDVGYAYCPLGEGYVFVYESPNTFQVVAELKCGEKVTVEDAADNNRARVRTADGKQGYVQKSSLTAGLPGSQGRSGASPAVGSQPPQFQPKPQPKPEIAPQSQPEPEAPLRTPQVQLQHSDLQAPTQPRAQPQSPAQLPAQLPPPAAEAFTPFSTLGYEQNEPRLEVFGGYSFMNAGTNNLVSRQNMNGFDSSVAYNVNRWLAAEGNVGAYYKMIDIVGLGTFGFHNYLVAGGPRVTVRKVFIHTLIGMDHLANNTYFDGVGPSSGNNVLAAELGGGVQWKVARHIGVRTSADYVLSRFEGWTQNSVRVTAGVVFDLGRL